MMVMMRMRMMIIMVMLVIVKIMRMMKTAEVFYGPLMMIHMYDHWCGFKMLSDLNNYL